MVRKVVINGIRKSNNYKAFLWGSLDRVVFVRNKLYIDAKLIIITKYDHVHLCLFKWLFYVGMGA